MKFCTLFNLSPCARYCLLIGSQLSTRSQGNLHYIRLHFFQLDREFFCLLPSLARLYSAAASPSERLRSRSLGWLVGNKLFKNVLQNEQNNPHELLPARNTCTFNLRNMRKFKPAFKTNRFRSSFITFNALKA